MPKDTVITAAKKLAARNQKVETATAKATRKAPKKRAKGKKQGGTTAEQAKRSERKGKSGERAFGAPLGTGAFDRQTTDSNNR